jgi:hypothetical protein
MGMSLMSICCLRIRSSNRSSGPSYWSRWKLSGNTILHDSMRRTGRIFFAGTVWVCDTKVGSPADPQQNLRDAERTSYAMQAGRLHDASELADAELEPSSRPWFPCSATRQNSGCATGPTFMSRTHKLGSACPRRQGFEKTALIERETKSAYRKLAWTPAGCLP